MKKRLIGFALLIAIVCSLMGCRKVECTWCNEEKFCKKMSILGGEVDVCAQCKNEIEELRKQAHAEED